MVHLKKAQLEFKKHLQSSGKSFHTITSYDKHLNELVEFLLELKKRHIHLVTKEDLGQFLDRLLKKGQSKKSINSKTVALKSFFKFLEINEYITKNPAAALKYLKEEVKAPRILSVVEYRALRDATRDDVRYHAIIELMLQTGIKIGEVSRLRIKDLKLDETAKLDILDERMKVSRTVPLNSPAKKALEEYLKVRPKVKSEVLFITRNGKAINPRNIRLAIANYYKKAGITNARVHDLRHTFCAHHIKKGTSLTAIAYMAGHKNLNTTRKYLECIETPKLEELEKHAL